MPNESTSLLQTNFVHEVEPIITIKDTNFTYSTAKTASTNLDASNNPTPVYENVGDFVVKDSTNATMMSVTTQYRSLSGTNKELVLFVSPKGNMSNSISMHFDEAGTKYIDVNNAMISNVKTPSESSDAATKGYVDGLPGVGLNIVSGIYTCTGDQNNTVIYIDHNHKNASGQSVAPKMVFACMYGHTSGGDTNMASGTVTMIVFATIPMTNGVLSTTQISFLIPDVTTSTSTKIMWTALFDE